MKLCHKNLAVISPFRFFFLIRGAVSSLDFDFRRHGRSFIVRGVRLDPTNPEQFRSEASWVSLGRIAARKDSKYETIKVREG